MNLRQPALQQHPWQGYPSLASCPQHCGAPTGEGVIYSPSWPCRAFLQNTLLCFGHTSLWGNRDRVRGASTQLPPCLQPPTVSIPTRPEGASLSSLKLGTATIPNCWLLHRALPSQKGQWCAFAAHPTQGLTYPQPASASQSPQRALLGCSSRLVSQKSSDTHQRLWNESEMMPGEAAKIHSSPAPSLQEMLTQAEVLLASPAKDVDELGLIRAPFLLTSFQQVLVGWGRWQRPVRVLLT